MVDQRRENYYAVQVADGTTALSTFSFSLSVRLLKRGITVFYLIFYLPNGSGSFPVFRYLMRIFNTVPHTYHIISPSPPLITPR